MYNPKNLGVVGPYIENKEVIRKIILFEFVHRTHFHIFGYFYPRIFSGWFADDWLSHAYQNNNAFILEDVIVNHKYTDPTYETNERKKIFVDSSIKFARQKIEDFKKYTKFPLSVTDTDKKIAIVFYKDEESLSNSSVRSLETERNMYLKGLTLADEYLTNSVEIYHDVKNNKPIQQAMPFNNIKIEENFTEILHKRPVSKWISPLDNELINEMNSNEMSCQVYYEKDVSSNSDKKFEILSLNFPRIREYLPMLSKDQFIKKEKLIELISQDCIVYTKEFYEDLPRNFKKVKWNAKYQNLIYENDHFKINEIKENNFFYNFIIIMFFIIFIIIFYFETKFYFEISNFEISYCEIYLRRLHHYIPIRRLNVPCVKLIHFFRYFLLS